MLLSGNATPALNHPSTRRLQSESLASHDVVLRLPDPLNPGSTINIPADESNLGALDFEAERALITQYKSVLDDIIHWFLGEPDKVGCQLYHAMRMCRPSRDGSYMSSRSQAQYICTQDEMMLYAQAHVRSEDDNIESMDDWTRVYATFLTRLGMTQLAADVRATLRPPADSPPPSAPLVASRTDDLSSLTSRAQSAPQEPTGMFELTAGTLMVLVGGACACGAASCACISRCRRTRGRRYQKLELQDFDQHEVTEQRAPGGNAATTTSATDILRAYAKSKQSRESP